MNKIPFCIAADLQPCRLLELPPDLLEYLSTSDAPSLNFKARQADDAEAFLTTHHKTYLVRHVHTSNTIYITCPSPHASTTLVALSKCASALECLPAPNQHAASTMLSLLTPFDHPQDLQSRPTPPLTKDHVFAQTPMSHDECQLSWEDSTAFEHSGASFRPTAVALVNVWKWLLDIAYANAVNLATCTSIKSIDKMLDGEDEWPRALVDAILTKLSHDKDEESLQLQQQVAIKWVGRNLLESSHQTEDKSAFIESWKDALPEAWRPHATLDMLKASLPTTTTKRDKDTTNISSKQGSYKLSSGGKRIEFASEQGAQAEEATANSAKPAATATAGKRKWHEKFAAARKQGKPS
jgi:sister chromatid cohesion protein DCC1